jgi:hypothetical protein
MWLAGTELVRSPGHRFYEKLDDLLSEAKVRHACGAALRAVLRGRPTSRGGPPSRRACTSGCCSSATSRESSRSGGPGVDAPSAGSRRLRDWGMTNQNTTTRSVLPDHKLLAYHAAVDSSSP